MFLLRYLLILLCLLPVPGTVRCAGGSVTDPERQLNYIRDLTDRALFDRAAPALDTLYEQLRLADSLDSRVGLQARVERAYLWDRNAKYERAVEELLAVVDRSRVLRFPEVEAYAYLLLALVHEEHEQAKEAEGYLHAAESIIRRHRMRELEAMLAIRTSSYQRLYGSQERAEYYARRALAHALDQNQISHQATAHLLLSILYSHRDPAVSRWHLNQTAEIYRSFGSHVNHLALAMNYTGLEMRAGNPEAALRYSDTAVYHFREAGHLGDSHEAYGSKLWLDRSRILQDLGRTDSAYYYLELSREAAALEQQHLNQARIAEIDARYRDEKRELLLEEQAQLLTFRHRRITWLRWSVALALGGLTLLFLNQLRLRRANASISAQRDVISEKNEALAASLREQQLLRGELHHRVKNNLQTVIGLLDLQIKNTSDADQQRGLEATVGRIYSIAAIHDILHRGDHLGSINFRTYVEELTHHLCYVSGTQLECTFDLDILPVKLSLDTAVPLGFLLNELLTNSFKYAARPGVALRIGITLTKQGSRYVLRYRDNGPGLPDPPPDPNDGGQGGYIMRGMARQLGGELLVLAGSGASYELRFATDDGHHQPVKQLPARPGTIPTQPPVGESN